MKCIHYASSCYCVVVKERQKSTNVTRPNAILKMWINLSYQDFVLNEIANCLIQNQDQYVQIDPIYIDGNR